MNLIASVVLFVLILFVVVCVQVRRNRLSMKYAFLWIVLSAVLLVLALIPGFLDKLAHALGFEVTSNMIFFIAIFVLMIIALSLTMIVSEQSKKIVCLSQEVSILKKELKEVGEEKQQD